MIGKTGKRLRGERLTGLLYYLYGPGRANEHEDPHLVAAWVDPEENDLEPLITGYRDGWPIRDFRRLVTLMQAPLDLTGARAPKKPVWHTVLRARDEDRWLSDAEWARIAHEVMDRLELGTTEDRAGVRWIAVRHDQVGIHLAAILAREDGTIPSLWQDFVKLRAACRWAEDTFGLIATNSGDRTADPAPTRAETEKTSRAGRSEPARDTLRRAVREAVVAARTPPEFAAWLQRAGVMCWFRFSRQNPDQVTGYSVGLPGDVDCDREQVRYAGRSLGPDLTWPRIIARWGGAREPGPAGSDRAAVYRSAATAAGQAAREATTAGEDELDDLALGADELVVALAGARNGPVDGRRAVPVPASVADGFARTGRRRHRELIRIRSTRTALLRAAARTVLVAGRMSGRDELAAWLLLAVEWSRLAETIAIRKLAQGRADQAAAARRSARALQALLPSRDPVFTDPALQRTRGGSGAAGAARPAEPRQEARETR